MADGCLDPFLRSPYVFTFVHLYYLPHLHCPATYIVTTQIQIFPPVQQSLLLSRKPIGPKHAQYFQIRRARATTEWPLSLLKTTTASPRQYPEAYASSRFWDGCDTILGEYYSQG
jgi:hypothetical protein